jgi:hypothetical protein
VVDRLAPLGIALGQVPASIQLALQGTEYKRPQTDSSGIAKVLNLVCFKHGFRWSMDNGALHLYSATAYTDDQDILLNTETGLIGSPSKAQAGGKTVGQPAPTPSWKATSLLNPLLTPGRKVVLQSTMIKLPAELAVWKVTHRGDTLSGDWTSDLEMGKLGSRPNLGPVASSPGQE